MSPGEKSLKKRDFSPQPRGRNPKISLFERFFARVTIAGNLSEISRFRRAGSEFLRSSMGSGKNGGIPIEFNKSPPPAGNRDKTSWFPGFFCRASTKAGVAQHLANPVVYQWFWVFPRKVYLTRGSFGNVADPLLKPARD